MRGAHELKSCTAQWACFNALTAAAHICGCETLTYPHPPGWNPLSSAQNQARNKCIMSSPGAPRVQRNPIYSVLIFKWHFIPVIFRCSLIVVYCYSSDFSCAVPSQIIVFWLSDDELPSKVAITAFNIVQSITAALWFARFSLCSQGLNTIHLAFVYLWERLGDALARLFSLCVVWSWSQTSEILFYIIQMDIM